MRAKILVAALVVMVIALMVRLATVNPGAGPLGRGRTPANDFTLTLTDGGGQRRLSDFKGKVLLLDFWATWCGPCRQSIPGLVRLNKHFQGKGLEIIGVSTDMEETRHLVPTAKKELGINYPIAFIQDSPSLGNGYAVKSLPTLYVIDKRGYIVGIIEGHDPFLDLEKEVGKLLNES